MISRAKSLKHLLWLSSMAFSLPLITTAQPPSPQGGHHGPAKISADAAKADPNSVIPVIIQYKQDPGAAQDREVAYLGGATDKTLHSIHAKTALLPAGQLPALAADPNVAYVSLDRPVHPREAVSMTAPDFAYQPINAPAAWSNGYVGTGIGVAVIDSGVTVVDDLQKSDNVTASGCCRRFRPNPRYPVRMAASSMRPTFAPGTKDAGTDQFGHGTHVAGLIAGNGKKSTGNQFTSTTFYGIAPNANIIDLRALDAKGHGTDSSVIAAIEQAIALKDQYNIRVINLSLGRPIWESYTQDPLCQAVEQAWKAGIVVVVAAGNDGRDLAINSMGYGTIEAPGNDPLRDHRGRHAHHGDPRHRRRSDRQLQLQGPFLHRSGCEAGYRGAGESGHQPQVPQRHAGGTEPDFRDVEWLLHEPWADKTNLERLLPAERHQHGHGGSQRSGRRSVRRPTRS